MKKSIALILCASVAACALADLDAAKPSFKSATPVWAKGRECECNLSLRFTSSVDLTGKEKQVFVRATGCSAYRLRVNGAFAGYGPARGPKGMDRVDEWNVKKFIHAGRNEIEIDVAGYNVPNYYLPDQPSYLCAEVVADGKILAATGKDSFRANLLSRTQKVPRYSYQRPFLEVWNVSTPVGAPVELARQPAKPLLPRRAAYPTFAVNRNAKKIADGRSRYDAKAKVRSYWALELDPAKYKGFATNVCDIVPSFEADRYVDDPKGAVRTATYDFGLLDCGFVGARAVCRGKGRVLVVFDEILTNGKVDYHRGGTGNVVIWNIDRPGEHALESFDPYAFRYAKFIVDGEIELSSPFIRTYKSPSADKVACPTSDPELKRIFEAARETFKQNALDVFTDCPGRERAGWLCDSYFTARVSKYMTGSLALEELFLENFLYADCPDIPKAMFPMCYPADHVNQNFIPNWAMWLVLEIEEYLGRGGSAAFVKRFEPKILALVEYLKTFENSDGLLENLPKWVFVEWSECNSHTKGVNYPSNMTWARVLDAVAKLYGKRDLAAKAAKIRETIRKQSFDGKWFHDQALRGKDGKLVLDPVHTETCQYYAFYFGVATRQSHAKLWNTLVNEFGPSRKAKNGHPDVPFSNAFIGNYLRLELLSNAGLNDAVESNIRGYFLKMADKTGTLWEHDSTEASCCHGFASYIAILIDRLSKRGKTAQRDIFTDGEFFIGCNYWAKHAGMYMWSQWKPEVVEREIAELAKNGVTVMRVFPLWSDFQPLTGDCYNGGTYRSYRFRDNRDLPNPDGVDPKMMKRFRYLCDVSERNGIRLVVGIVTGWMSGRQFVPSVFEEKNVITDPDAVLWQTRFVRHFVRKMKDHPAIAAWDYGNECNCMWTGQADQSAFYNWMEHLAMAIRLEDSTRPIVSGMHGLSTDEKALTPIRLNAEVSDILCTHPYSFYVPGCGKEPFNTMRTILHPTAESLLYRDIGGKPCFVEEIGNLGTACNSDERTASGMRATMFSAWANDLKGCLWWCNSDQEGLLFPPYTLTACERELGLLRQDYTPKPIMTEMKAFQEFRQRLPFRKLPKARTDAVIVVPEKTSGWIPGFGAYLLARQAGLNPSFAGAERKLPESRLYIVCSSETDPSYTYPAQCRIFDKVRNGATAILIYSGNSRFTHLRELTGVKVDYGTLSPIERKFTLKSSPSRPMVCADATTTRLLPAEASVLAATDDGEPILTRFALGKGQVVLCNSPVDRATISRTDVLTGEKPMPYYLLFREALQSISLGQVVEKGDCPYVGITEHPRADGSTIVMAINFEPRQITCPVRVKGSVKTVWRGNVTSNRIALGPNEAALFEVK